LAVPKRSKTAKIEQMSSTGTIAAPRRRRAGGLRWGPAERTLAVVMRARRREILGCAGVLGLLTLAMSAAHIRHGGLYYDDWAMLALGRFPPPGGLLHGLWLDYGQRPGQVLYYAALDRILGASAAARLGLAAGMLALQATVLYALLRRLGLRARDALACAALSLTFPFSDSVWLWSILSLASLAIAASLLGVALALRAFERSGARALALHGASLALYVAGMLSYELFAVAGCLAGVLYVHAVGWARARVRWALDVAAILATLLLARAVLPIDVATPSRMQSLTGAVAHAGQIASAGARVAGAALLPVDGVTPWAGAGLLAAGLAAAALTRARLPRGERARAELGRWLAIALAGVVLALAAWAVYLPASDHYSPSAAGTVNRVNALAASGVAVLVYAFLVLLGGLLAQLARLPRTAAAAIASVLALALCAAYVQRGASDARAWDAAAADQQRVLASVRAALPRLPGGAVLYAYDAPLTAGPGVPVLNTQLDLASAVRVAYADPALTAVPILAEEVRCGSRGPRAAGVAGVYGSSYLLDVRARSAVRLMSAAQCQALVHAAGAATTAGRAGRGRR
jgi:hypothetical protein